jgi:glucosamine-6-phosphate deaminase
MPEHFNIDKLKVLVLEDRKTLGEYAAQAAAAKINALSAVKDEINIIFAAAPSQIEFLEILAADPTIAWNKINAFHMDEYIGLPLQAPQSFGLFLQTTLFNRVPLKSVHLIDGRQHNIKQECLRYAELLKQFPPDIVCMGIGENTHIAFNDPPKARFDDPETVKLVRLDTACRQQQVNDGCFEQLHNVPEYAITLTIPALLSAPYIFCMVPGKFKAEAVKHTLSGVVTQQYPSTILRNHREAILFVDHDSYSLLK